MRKVIWIFFLITLLYAGGFSKDLAVSSAWTTATLEIDGKTAEWADAAISTEEKLSIDLAFRNDSDFLYVLFMFKDPEFMSSIAETGLTVYFNTDGKKKKSEGLKFIRQTVPAEAFMKILEEQSGPLTEEQKKEVMSRKTYSIRRYKIIERGKDQDIPTDVEQVQRALFRTDVNAETKTAIYELMIPLNKASDAATGIGTQAGQSLKVGFEWGGLTPERRAMLMQRVGDQSASASAGSATGSATSERGVSDGGASIASIGKMAPKKYVFWVDLQLAKQ